MTDHHHADYVEGCFRCDLSRDEVQRNVDERQALFNAATVIARVARRWNRHPATRAVMLRVADRLHERATAMLTGPDG